MQLGVVLAAIATCLLVQGFFAASEIALVAADELKVRAAHALGEERARVLSALLADRARLLALILTGNNLATAVAAAVLTSFLSLHGAHLAYLAPFILAPLTLLLGESIPKLTALKRPLFFAGLVARPLHLLAAVLAPVLAAETAFSRQLRRLAGVPAGAQSVFLTREDLALLVHRETDGSHEDADSILPAERRMISRIFRFAGEETRKVMIPLVRVEAISEQATVAQAIEVVRSERFSRLPVFEGGITNITGVVHIFDLLEAPDLSRPVREVMRPVSYFAESTPLGETLIALQHTGENLAVIVDEYGGAAGILTVEDLLEEIVGEIGDEDDTAEEIARVLNPTTIIASARAPVAELNERFDIRLPEDGEYATIGGLVVERLGHIPKSGEHLRVGEVAITVTRSDRRAVREVMLKLAHPLRPDLSAQR